MSDWTVPTLRDDQIQYVKMDAIALHYLNIKTTVDWSCNPPRPLDPDSRPTFYSPTGSNIAQISQLDHGGDLRASSLNSTCSPASTTFTRINLTMRSWINRRNMDPVLEKRIVDVRGKMRGHLDNNKAMSPDSIIDLLMYIGPIFGRLGDSIYQLLLRRNADLINFDPDFVTETRSNAASGNNS